MIRAANTSDLEGILELAEARRRQYANYQPVFWRPAHDAAAHQRRYLAGLVEDEGVVSVVAVDGQRLLGFAIARLVPAPPVYDPGGLTCLVDDFAVIWPELWSTLGVDLLRTVRDLSRQRGARQVVVVTGHEDQPKRASLRTSGLSIASEWWVASIDSS